MNASPHILTRLGQRFLNPDAEVQYQKWRKPEVFPVMYFAAWSGTCSWLLAVVTQWILAPTIFSAFAWQLYGVLLPLFLLVCAIGKHRLVRPQMLLIATSLNLVSGLYVTYLGYGIGDNLGSASAMATLVCFYAPFMRLPPLYALLSCGPYMGLLLGISIQNALGGNLSEIEKFAYITGPIMSMTTILIVCGVLERLLRRSYTREQLILEQQSGLEESRRMIRRYIPPAVAEQIIAGHSDTIDTPRRRRVTILFSDIVGFTDMADRLDAESLTQILNEYMATMADIVEQHGGTLNEFSGDGLMALFGAPKDMPPADQALKSIQAAQQMQRRLPALNEDWLKLGIGDPLQIRIGINTGVLSVGSFGSQGRMTYTAIGLQTNIASRIQSHCEPGGILLSDASWQLVKDKIECEPQGEVECKGVHFPVKVYSPSGIEVLP